MDSSKSQNNNIKKKNSRMWTMLNSWCAIVVLFLLIFVGYKNIYMGFVLLLTIAFCLVIYLEHRVNNCKFD